MQPARSEKKLRGLQAALAGMFNQMDQAISATTFETNNDLRYSVTTFLIRFDAKTSYLSALSERQRRSITPDCVAAQVE